MKGRYKGRVDVEEAQKVAETAILFMATEPRNRGIVTLNQTQRDVLLEEIERLHIPGPSNRVTLLSVGKARFEPFFVKNLENVQGDERDVIFISTVYGS